MATEPLFTEIDGHRMRQLQQLMEDDQACPEDICELQQLAKKWQAAYTQHLLDNVPVPDTEPSNGKQPPCGNSPKPSGEAYA